MPLPTGRRADEGPPSSVALNEVHGRPHRRTVLRLAALAALIAGFVALSTGSVTAAPLLLVIAYMILIPAVILA